MSFVFTNKKGKSFELPTPLAPLAETHAHLTLSADRSPAETLCRAAQAGVRIHVIPIDIVSDVGPHGRFEQVSVFLQWLDEQIAQAHELYAEALRAGEYSVDFDDEDIPAPLSAVRFVAGAHPYSAAELDDAAMTRLEELLDSPLCVGVGEIGLDFGPHNELEQDVQLEAFRRQLRVAHEHELPVELHLRNPKEGEPRAHRLCEQLLCEEGLPRAGCDLHCFTEGPEIMKPFVEMGCFVAFGGAATFKRSDDIRRAACACPAHLILSETDSPFMTPEPLRGMSCEPAMIGFTVAAIAGRRAEETAILPEQTYRALWENARNFFGL